MAWLLGGLAVFALLFGLAVVSEWWNTVRYRMTVEVQTPQGVRSGSAVREVTHHGGKGWDWLPSFLWFGEQRPQWRLRGEAVAVDLPNGQTLFALLRSEASADFAGREIWSIFEQAGQKTVELWPSAPRTDRPRIHNPWPMLARFRDINDPTTADRVDPANLNSTFGSGYSLKSVIVERTHDAVTDTIDTRLRWRRDFPKGQLNGDRFENVNKPELAAHLSAYSFSTKPVK